MKTKVMWEQVDKTGDNFTHSWLLSVSSKIKMSSAWKWVPGRPSGCWVTKDWDAAVSMARALGLEIKSNGTHAVHNTSMYYD